MKKHLFIMPMVLMSLVSAHSWADHYGLDIDIFPIPYKERCVADNLDVNLLGIPGCLCKVISIDSGQCIKFGSEEEYNQMLKRDHQKDHEAQAREKAFNKCMFKNIKPSSSLAHYTTVKKYCKDQAGE
jgi:hypothetical protein